MVRRISMGRRTRERCHFSQATVCERAASRGRMSTSVCLIFLALVSPMRCRQRIVQAALCCGPCSCSGCRRRWPAPRARPGPPAWTGPAWATGAARARQSDGGAPASAAIQGTRRTAGRRTWRVHDRETTSGRSARGCDCAQRRLVTKTYMPPTATPG